MNSKYIRYLFKNRKIAIIFFLALYAALSLSTFIGQSGMNAGEQMHEVMHAGMLMSLIMTYGLPVLVFSYVHMKRSTDVYFAIPVSRRDQLISNIFFMFALCYGYFLTATLIGGILTGFGKSLINFLTVQLASAFILLVLLTVNSVMFLLANNTFDGIVMMGAYTLLPLFITLANQTFFQEMIAGFRYRSESLEIVNYFWPAYQAVEVYRAVSNSEPCRIIHVVILILFGIAGMYLLKKHFIDRKTERAEQLSDEPAAYPFIIHAYALICMVIITCCPPREYMSGRIIYYLLLLLAYVVATFVYKRKIEIRFRSLMIFLSGLCAAFILNFTAWQTHGFGRAERYTIDEGDYLAVEINCHTEPDNIEKPFDNIKNDYLYMSYRLIMPLAEKDQYREVLELLDSKRRESISQFYSQSRQDASLYMNMEYSNITAEDLNLYHEKGYYTGTNRYTYFCSNLFTVSELKLLDQYGELGIYKDKLITAPDGTEYWASGEYTLDDYLAGKIS
ncbi:MAG: ABC transporter permease [Solobacterium sp.]|nr:ABC transporter permease [Solobacterium sp.]